MLLLLTVGVTLGVATMGGCAGGAEAAGDLPAADASTVDAGAPSEPTLVDIDSQAAADARSMVTALVPQGDDMLALVHRCQDVFEETLVVRVGKDGSLRGRISVSRSTAPAAERRTHFEPDESCLPSTPVRLTAFDSGDMIVTNDDGESEVLRLTKSGEVRSSIHGDVGTRASAATVEGEAVWQVLVRDSGDATELVWKRVAASGNVERTGSLKPPKNLAWSTIRIRAAPRREGGFFAVLSGSETIGYEVDRSGALVGTYVGGARPALQTFVASKGAARGPTVIGAWSDAMSLWEMKDETFVASRPIEGVLAPNSAHRLELYDDHFLLAGATSFASRGVERAVSGAAATLFRVSLAGVRAPVEKWTFENSGGSAFRAVATAKDGATWLGGGASGAFSVGHQKIVKERALAGLVVRFADQQSLDAAFEVSKKNKPATCTIATEACRECLHACNLYVRCLDDVLGCAEEVVTAEVCACAAKTEEDRAQCLATNRPVGSCYADTCADKCL